MSNNGRYDLIIRGGIVFKDKPPHWMKADIAVKNGRIAAIAETIPHNVESMQGDVLEYSAAGQMVLPGLVDFHTHVYWGGTPLGINPDKLAALTGVTTWVDMGSAGAGNFEGLYYHVLKRSNLNILCFLHLSYVGLVPVGDTRLRFGELFDARLADTLEAARVCKAFPDAIKGLKIRIGMESSLTDGLSYLDMALALGDSLGLPLVVHATSAPPSTAVVLSRLRPGDIFTHCFATSPTSGIVDHRGEIIAEALAAKKRGVKFDLGYGARSFDSATACVAIRQGFYPDFVSSDLHAYSLASTISGLPAAISSLCNAGLSLEEAILGATTRPAGYLGLGGEKSHIQNDQDKAAPAIAGHLQLGSPADICLFAWSKEDVEHLDGAGRASRAPGLEVKAVFRKGKRLESFDDGRQEARWKPGLVARK
ncbi:MAG: amidohydrolase/deacetylase family metallohydrolase [Spirochaetia bacterium]|jgi:dihydroorotase|nr:amidohydrolase/deacetylase family metallohydrolase [Spirochaetia bacterium]